MYVYRYCKASHPNKCLLKFNSTGTNKLQFVNFYLIFYQIIAVFRIQFFSGSGSEFFFWVRIRIGQKSGSGSKTLNYCTMKKIRFVAALRSMNFTLTTLAERRSSSSRTRGTLYWSRISTRTTSPWRLASSKTPEHSLVSVVNPNI